ncbi:MAG: response regulator [Pseudomonadota bacterium]
MTQNNNFFTIPQAAKFCSISRVTLWRWVKSGKLKAFLTPGGQYKIRKDDLVSFIRGEMGHLPGNEFSQETKILIVVDDPQVQKLFKKMLSRNGYSIEVASDGFEAGVKTVQFKPDLIILDLIMPGMNGFEVCRQIKQNANTSHIKIIACTGYDTKENKDRIMQAGADGYLVKPVEKSALFQKIKGLLSDTM